MSLLRQGDAKQMIRNHEIEAKNVFFASEHIINIQIRISYCGKRYIVLAIEHGKSGTIIIIIILFWISFSAKKSAAPAYELISFFQIFFLWLFTDRRKNRIQFASIWNEIWCFCFVWFQWQSMNKDKKYMWKKNGKKRQQHNLLNGSNSWILMRSNDCVSPSSCAVQ